VSLTYTRRVCPTPESSWIVKVATTDDFADDFASLADFYGYCSNIMMRTEKRPQTETEKSSGLTGRVKDVIVEDFNEESVSKDSDCRGSGSTPLVTVTAKVPIPN
jgi:hypothetical protein